MAFLMRFVRSLRTGAGLTVLAVATVVISGSVLLISSTSSGETGTIAVHLESRDEAGPDAFTLPLGDGDEEWAGFELPSPTTGPLPQVVGTEPGLYGGTGVDDLCNKNLLIRFLKDEPAKATAWARAQGIETGSISRFVHSLTPARLLVDTWVLNHGFRDGEAIPRHSVLQAGSAVLLDDQGVPRVRCKCGNPLRATDVTEGRPTVEFIGEPWEGFEGDEVRRTVPGRQVDRFELVDLGSSAGTRLRPTGSDGVRDVIVDEDGEQTAPTPGLEAPVPELPLHGLRLSDLQVLDSQVPVPDILDPPTAGSGVLDPPVFDPPTARPDIRNPPTAGPEILDPPVFDPPTARPDIRNPPTAGPEILDPPVFDPPTAGPDILNPPTAGPEIIDPPTAAPEIIDPPTAAPEIIDPPTIGPEIIDPPTAGPEIIDPPTAGPEIIDPPVFDPPTAGPEILDPPVFEGPFDRGQVFRGVLDPRVSQLPDLMLPNQPGF